MLLPVWIAEGDADRADAAAGYDEKPDQVSVAAIVQRADHRAKLIVIQLMQAMFSAADCVSQIEPILVSEQSMRPGEPARPCTSAIQKAGAAGAQRDVCPMCR